MPSMQAMTISRYGKTPLQMSTMPMPEIRDHEVLVAIHAASVNPIDFKIRDGKVKILLHYDMPLILGNDFAGTVVKTGQAVQRFKTGDAVYGRPAKSRIGTFAEYIAVHEGDIAAKPANLSFAEAASIPLVGLTAYQAFYEALRLKAGDKILIHAGAGGLGTFAIQLAKHIGAYAATTASPAGHDLVARLGADHIINYREENFADVLHAYDAVLDTLGGDALKQSFRILKPGGHIVSVSALPTARFAREWRLPAWTMAVCRRHPALAAAGKALPRALRFLVHARQRSAIGRNYSADRGGRNRARDRPHLPLCRNASCIGLCRKRTGKRQNCGTAAA